MTWVPAVSQQGPRGAHLHAVLLLAGSSAFRHITALTGGNV